MSRQKVKFNCGKTKHVKNLFLSYFEDERLAFYA